jgi:hypothetical protein
MRMGWNKKSSTCWLGLAAFTWSMLFMWQGLDFTDMGVWLTCYQQFYSCPTQGAIFSSCWLTCFIGHWFGLVLGGGVLAYKLGYVVVITLIAIISFHLLATQFGRSRMLAATILLTVLYNRIYCGNWVAYYELTALFFLAGVALLFWGLVDNRMFLLVLAGTVLGVNTFIRLPNLLGIALLSAVWLYGWSCRWSFRKVIVKSAWFLCGFLAGIGLVLGMIYLHGHELIYYQDIQKIIRMSLVADSGYSSSGLFKRLIWDHFLAFIKAVSIVLFGVWAAKKISKQKMILVAIGILAGASLLFYVIYVRDQWQWCITGLCYLVLLSIVFLKSRKRPALALLAFFAGLVLFLTPLGSGDGISIALYGMWLALPLTLMWLWQGLDISLSLKLHIQHLKVPLLSSVSEFRLEQRTIRIFGLIILLALMFQSLFSAWQFTFRDSHNRFTMNHSIRHPLLHGVYTTAERARVVRELLDAMSRYTKPGDDVLAYHSIATVHFLTQTHPWLGDAWPDLLTAEMITTQIRQMEQAGAKLPCIVRAKASTFDDSWPGGSEPLKYWHAHKNSHLFTEFARKHGYGLTWSNDFFEILTPVQ